MRTVAGGGHLTYHNPMSNPPHNSPNHSHSNARPNSRDYDAVDSVLIGVSRMLTAFSRCEMKPHAERPFPSDASDENLTDDERRLAGRYMRVNHVGEVCAQALYHSQAITARDDAVRVRMTQAAVEENDHLAWCEQRLDELGARQSLLNPLWRAGAFAIGGVAGIAGDKWNLGFVAETERQVVAHLESHLGKLPHNDRRSREVVAQMQADENRHAEAAIDAGGAELPPAVKELMRGAAKVMTTTAHWI